MYTSIPNIEVKNIIKDILDRAYYTKQEVIHELLNITNTILEINYIQFNDDFYKQQDGLSMCALTSAILAEIFINFRTQSFIKFLKNTRSSTTTDM
jgi:hypothetical protein